MATGVYEAINDYLACQICTNRLLCPKMLPCRHTFCKACLEEWAKSNRGKLTCPSCRQECPLPAEGVDGLRSNQFAEGLPEMISTREGAVDSEGCESKMCENPAVIWCVDCCQFFCQECRRSHEIVRSLSKHRLLTMEEYNSPNAPRPCKVHIGDLLDFFCQNCQVTLCRKCAREKHNSTIHDVIEIKDAALAYLSLVEASSAHFETFLASIKREKENIDKTIDELKKQSGDMASKVTTEADKAIRKIEQERERLLGEIDQISREREERAVAEVNKLKTDMGRMESLQAYVANIARDGNRCDILNGKKSFEEELENVTKVTASQRRRIPPRTVFHFEINDAFIGSSMGRVAVEDDSEPQGAVSPMTVANNEHSSTRPQGQKVKTEAANTCRVCRCSIQNKTTLPCRHAFCKNCIDLEVQANGQICPVCKTDYKPRMLFGKMPQGEMDHRIDKSLILSGDPPKSGCIVIEYHFPDGIQGIQGGHLTVLYGMASSTRQVLQEVLNGMDIQILITFRELRSSWRQKGLGELT
ncbi:E3 ubiquitin-protein ligase TRIM56-like isoform X2 [Ptychodera flava]|uniref:E3 ubiquitin-protein ligase TRIM56-like isoform X2 n=1 Tax=Ptychodera flava TaxID=63121 RepID=UPI00396A7AE0